MRKMTVTKKPDHRGEHEVSRKTIARGMPGRSGVTVVTNSCAFYFAHEAAGASGARHSLRPLNSESGTFPAKLARKAAARSRSRVRRHCVLPSLRAVSGVIARSIATKQSNLSFAALTSPRLRRLYLA